MIMNTKSIFTSRTFWLNIAGASTIIVGALPEKYAVPTMAVLNIINRFFTTGGVTLTMPSK